MAANSEISPFTAIYLSVPLTGLELPKSNFVLFCYFTQTPILREITEIYANTVLLILGIFLYR